MLGPAAVAAHKTLAASIPSLEVVPVPGLVVAAKLLLYIWDAVQEVDVRDLQHQVGHCLISAYTRIDESARIPTSRGTLRMYCHYPASRNERCG